MIIWYPADSKWDLNPYYLKSVEWYKKNYKAELLCWLYHADHNYFTLPLLDGSGDVTPLMLFHRGERDDPRFKFTFDDESTYIQVKNKYTGKITYEDDPNSKNHAIIKKYPWIIMTEGCDDGHIGWKFETKDLAKRWVYYLYNTELNMDYYEFMDLFKENQGWRN